MSVLKVNTLGCHPMLLLKKMAAAGGITILKEEKRTFSGVDYPYRIVAQVAEGMYLEAHDVLHERLSGEEALPKTIPFNETTGHDSPLPHVVLEALEGHKELPFCLKSTPVYLTNIPTITDWTDFSFSVLASFPGMYSAQESDCPFVGYIASRAKSFEKVGARQGTDTFMAVSAINGDSVTPVYSTVFYSPAAARPPFTVYAGRGNVPLGETTSDGLVFTTPSVIHVRPYVAKGFPIVFAMSRLRIGANVDETNELTSPSPWKPFPIFTSVSKSNDGLFFQTGPSGILGGVLGFAKVDTTKGNLFGSGECLALYKNYPESFSLESAPPREELLVYGTPANANASKTMSVYIATPPVSQDIVVGGPVVSEIYAFDSDEIRGAVQGVLGIAETVDVGTMGWLDGNRYRVLIPGRMTRVG